MDPFLEKNPIFHELHTQFLAEAQRLLQPQVRPKYLAKLERHLSEGSTWDMEGGSVLTLERKEPDLTLSASGTAEATGSTATLLAPLASRSEELEPAEQELRRQRRIVIYVNAAPRLAVASIELLSPSNKAAGSVGQARYLEKRASALHGGLHWVEIDLLRSGQRPPIPVPLPHPVDYLTYVAQATPTGWNHLVYGWGLRDPFQRLSIPLLGNDRAVLDLGACFSAAYDSTAADEEAGYDDEPPPPPLNAENAAWVEQLLRERGLR
jgi:hypothetical protein